MADRRGNELLRVAGYGLAIAMSAAGLLLRGVLPVGPGIAPFPVAVATVVLTAWSAGRGPGWVAALISAAGLQYFVLNPVHGFAIQDTENAIGLLAFLAIAALLIEFSMARHRVEHALSESEGRFRLLAENVPEVLWIEGLEPHRLLYASPSFERVWGRRVGDVYRNPDLWQEAIHPDDRQRVRDTYAKWVAGGESGRYDVEYRILRPDGETRWIHDRGVLIRDARGKLFRASGIAEDISQRYEAQEELARTQAELAHVTRVTAMGELAVSIAHDVNQPLTAITANASASLNWLAANPPNLDEARQSNESILKAAARAGEIIRGIRALVGKAPSRKEPIDLNQAIAEVVSLTRAEAQRRRVHLDVQLARDLPAVVGDRVQLQQAVLNLILNGVDAAGAVAEGPRELVVSSERDAGKGVLVSVRDTGGGFDEAKASRLFDAFFTTKPGGLGMGLAISRSIVESHRGRIWAAPNSPRGAVFRFTVPVLATA